MNDRIEFALSGQAILMKNIEVSLSMTIQSSDQSGQASSTNQAQQGIKAKQLKVVGIIPFSDVDTLTQLYALAEAQEADGSMKRYRVNHDMARAIKFREATFTGNVDTAKAPDLMAWRVNFSLTEYFSVAEKKAEARAAAGGSGARVQTAQGTSSAADTPEELGWFEKVLKRIDTAIGPAGGNK